MLGNGQHFLWGHRQPNRQAHLQESGGSAVGRSRIGQAPQGKIAHQRVQPAALVGAVEQAAVTHRLHDLVPGGGRQQGYSLRRVIGERYAENGHLAQCRLFSVGQTCERERQRNFQVAQAFRHQAQGVVVQRGTVGCQGGRQRPQVDMVALGQGGRQFDRHRVTPDLLHDSADAALILPGEVFRRQQTAQQTQCLGVGQRRQLVDKPAACPYRFTCRDQGHGALGKTIDERQEAVRLADRLEVVDDQQAAPAVERGSDRGAALGRRQSLPGGYKGQLVSQCRQERIEQRAGLAGVKHRAVGEAPDLALHHVLGQGGLADAANAPQHRMPAFLEGPGQLWDDVVTSDEHARTTRYGRTGNDGRFQHGVLPCMRKREKGCGNHS